MADEEETKIDITPMLDVVFIMLIFFIVTATFIKESGINLPSLPSPERNIVEASDSILIQILANDRVSMGNRDVDTRRITANVQRMKAESPEAKIIIQASKRSKNNTLVQVMDSVRLAGVYAPLLAQSTD